MPVESPPIIVKKIKKGGHGHHGGAWKVAYADFVTAMMAFFMLLWLLGSTTEQQKQAIQNYMNDPLASTGPGGAGANPVLEGGDGILEGDGPSPFPMSTPGESEDELEGVGAPSEEDVEKLAAQAERERMESLLEDLKQAIDAGQALKPFKDQLLLDITNEGLRIQIVDRENRAMFASGSPVLEPYAREILREIVKVINQVPNRISISGHTDRTPYASSNGYSNWELSADRANASRRELVAGGMPDNKLLRLQGMAASDPLEADNPTGAINRRISITVMTREAEERIRQSFNNPAAAPGALPVVPSPAPGVTTNRPAFVPDLASRVSQPTPLPAAPATAPAR